MLQTSPGKFVGIWSANVAPGICNYKVSIVATSSGNAETFDVVLKIEGTG